MSSVSAHPSPATLRLDGAQPVVQVVRNLAPVPLPGSLRHIHQHLMLLCTVDLGQFGTQIRTGLFRSCQVLEPIFPRQEVAALSRRCPPLWTLEAVTAVNVARPVTDQGLRVPVEAGGAGHVGNN